MFRAILPEAAYHMSVQSQIPYIQYSGQMPFQEHTSDSLSSWSSVKRAGDGSCYPHHLHGHHYLGLTPQAGEDKGCSPLSMFQVLGLYLLGCEEMRCPTRDLIRLTDTQNTAHSPSQPQRGDSGG